MRYIEYIYIYIYSVTTQRPWWSLHCPSALVMFELLTLRDVRVSRLLLLLRAGVFLTVEYQPIESG